MYHLYCISRNIHRHSPQQSMQLQDLEMVSNLHLNNFEHMHLESEVLVFFCLSTHYLICHYVQRMSNESSQAKTPAKKSKIVNVDISGSCSESSNKKGKARACSSASADQGVSIHKYFNTVFLALTLLS